MKFSDLEIKAVKVIESCESLAQLESAQVYITLFYERTKNLPFFKYLIEKMNERHEEITRGA